MSVTNEREQMIDTPHHDETAPAADVRPAPPAVRRRHRDHGAVLPLVLVMSVIGALVILPLMTYAVAVTRSNRVLSDGTRNMEAVRAGARIAISDPLDLFDRCQTGASVAIPMPPLDQPVTTTCRQLSEVGVIDDVEIPYGAVATQLGEAVPATFRGSICSNTEPCNTTSDPSEAWWDAIDEPLPTQDTIWMPDLPERVSYLPEADGYPMPASFGQCRVFFPGTYDAPVVLHDRTYFASGDYYFLDDVVVVGGADVVAGFGVHESCANDIEVVLDMEVTPPNQYNITGGGATWVFGDAARLIVDNQLTVDGSGNLAPNTGATPLRLVMNQRYVEDPADPNARVSIATVNGDIDAVAGPPEAAGPLLVPGVIEMPISTVALSSGDDVDAVTHGYTPSIHTAEPRPPAAPTGFTVTPYRNPSGMPSRKGAAKMAWDTPDDTASGGATVTRYVVVDATTYVHGTTDIESAKLCETDGRTECTLIGLKQGSPGYTLAVLAENTYGWSEPSAPAGVTPLASHAQLLVPTQPLNVTFDEYDEAALVRWDAPANDGGTSITQYTVTAYEATTSVLTPTVEVLTPVGSCTTARFRDDPARTECVIDGLDDLDDFDPVLVATAGYRFGVVATNTIGNSPESVLTDPAPAELDGPEPPAPYAPVVPVAGPYVPAPVVDVDVSGSAASTIEIAGYTAVPQGRVRVANPNRHAVALRGGVVSGSYDVDAAEAGDPSTTVGFTNTVLQRTLQITSTSTGRASSAMIVQINESGAFEVNSWVIQ